MLLILLLNHFLWAKPSALEGRWLQGCQYQANREELFVGNDVTLSEFYYADGLCTAPLMTIRNAGEFTLTDTTIDFIFNKITLTAEDESIVFDYNTRAVCGFTDWKLNEAKNITGLKCALVTGGLPLQIAESGQKRFGIYKIEGDLLYFGRLEKDHDALSPETRPISFDPRSYKKAPQP